MPKAPQEDVPRVSAGVVRAHLEAICNSRSFAASKRCQEFLRYIIQETLHGRAELIKERNIAHEVFGKDGDFEPSEFSLVRVRAGEVRRRLSDFYQLAPECALRIELPLGSYAPRIHYLSAEAAAAAPVAAPSAETLKPESFASDADPVRPNRRRFLWLAGGTSCAALIATAFPLLRSRVQPLDLLWRPVFATKGPLLIFIPILRTDRDNPADAVGIGPSAALGRAAVFLTQHHYPYRLRFGSDLTFSDLREQPSLLLGGFDIEWTLRMTQNLRFAPLVGHDSDDRAFVDRRTQQTWKPSRNGPEHRVDVDYGILCRLFDAMSGQIVFLAVGAWTYGTEGAASVLFDPASFAALIKNAPPNWPTKSFQAVIRVAVIGTTPSSPRVIATYFW